MKINCVCSTRTIGSRVLFWLLAFFLLGMGPGARAGRAEVLDRVVAIVNEDIITLSDLNKTYMPYLKQIKDRGYALEKQRETLFQGREQILYELINGILTDQEIKRIQVTVSEQEIDAALEKVKSIRMYTDAELKVELDRLGLTRDKYRQHFKRQILREKLINSEVISKVVVPRADAEAYYEKNVEQFTEKEQYHLGNIIMKTGPGEDPERKQAVLKKMEAVLEELTGGTPFDKQAKIHSESPFAAEGGDLGLFTFDQLSPQIQTALRGLAVGEFTPILDTEQGYQIFLVREIIDPKIKSLPEVASEIQEKLYRELVDAKFEFWIEDLRERSSIKILW